MRRGIKVRLLAFVLLSAVGMVYVGASYLGFVDQVLGRGYTVHVLLPQSGGLYTGSEATYRGVKIGEVSRMVVDGKGMRVDVALQDDARVPSSSPVFVHNLSAVGEQYLSFEPASKQGPMLQAGDTVRGTMESLPLGEEVLMQDLSRFVKSVNGSELNTVVSELGTMFRGNATPLRSMVDSAQAFIQAAQANESPTVDLLHNAQTVLQTQADNSANIHAFARDLAVLTGTLASSDAKIRRILDQAGPAADELMLLVKDLRRILPPFLTHVVSVSEVLDARLPALEQLLVTFPRLVSAGPSALTPGGPADQKFGRVNLNLNQVPGACVNGYLTSDKWRPTSELKPATSPPLPSKKSFKPYFPAECKAGPPQNMRGMKYAPDPIDWKSELAGGDE
jgi:phospholipid/cholesterol/gamma-HCH transport system substrate-binding protein